MSDAPAGPSPLAGGGHDSAGTAPASAEGSDPAGGLPASVDAEIRALARLRGWSVETARELVFAASLDADRRARAAVARAAGATVPPSPLDPLETYVAHDAVRSLLRDDGERAKFGEVLDDVRAEIAASGSGVRSESVVLARRESGRVVAAIRLEGGRLVYTTWRPRTSDGGVEWSATDFTIVAAVEQPEVRLDESGRRWVSWTLPDCRLRAPHEEAVAALGKRYRLTGTYAHATAAWLAAYPVAGECSTRLALLPPSAGRPWHIPPEVWAVEQGGSRSPAAIVAGWYRPRGREEALALLGRLRGCAVTTSHKVILAYAAGAPIARALAPSRVRPYAECIGISGAGKTAWAVACIATCWGLGGRAHEFLDPSALGSEFRFEAWLAATDFPLLVDESELSSEQHRRLRRAVSGGLGSRGRGDQTVKAYDHTAPVVLTSNREPDESDVSPSERSGDERRRIRLRYGVSDCEALTAERRAAFAQLTADLAADTPPDPDGGGAALWALRDLEAREPGVPSLRTLSVAYADDRRYVLAVGAALVGLDVADVVGAVDIATDPAAEEDFLAWLRATATRWIGLVTDRRTDGEHNDLGPRRPDDALLARISVLTRDAATVRHAGDVPEYVYVTAAALSDYRAECRRRGRDSAMRVLPDLRALASITGQAEDEVCDARRGHVRRIAGQSARVAIIRPWAPVRSAAVDARSG